MKTISQRGAGFDRPFKYDEMTLDLKVYQGETIFQQFENQEYLLNEEDVIRPTVKKVL